ncbi:glycosyltransferase family 4 protein [Rhizobiales bacterium Sp-1]|uniref:Glycosyltransferase family 4 protein n=2 Tax=Segnochrobactrum spirostomi TaxID=2608987 RepID=A0A6A7Y4B4_9HYPH|nr:glycosyltransferase family 4 protein [Segnochrobactrum spirostomi]
MAAWRAGYRTAYAPAAALIHHEGATRGHTNPPADLTRLADDIRRFGLDGDPYLHPELDGTSPNPRPRASGGIGAYEALQRNVATTGTFVLPSHALDLWDDGECLAAADLPREAVLWWPQAAHKVVDVWSAARWCLDLLRCRADIRTRFPTALSDGIEGPFATWLIAEGPALFGLPETIGTTLRDLFAGRIGGRARRAFLWREDVRARWPHGLTPAGRREILRWFLRDGRREENLRLEEIWWLLWSAAERPEQELVWAYLVTPAWQASFPDAMSRFGAERFARWFAAAFHVDGAWIDPSRWPLPGSASDQIRVGYVAHQRWRDLHPDALADEAAARAFLAWLLEQNALAPWARGWLGTLDLGAVAVELARPGANMIAHFRYPSGLRVSAESIAEGLAAVGAGVSLRDARTQPNDDPGHELVSGLEIYDTTIIHLQPEPLFDAAYLRADLSERRPRTYRIAYWYWEFDTIPASWREQAETADEVWAASEFVAKGLRERLDLPVRTEFPGVSLAPFHARPRSHFGVPEEEFVFLFTFHMMSVMERKNPLGLIRAFRRAFTEPEPARLVIKTSFGQRYPDQIAALRDAAQGSRITIIDEIYSPEDVLALTDVCDVYVSLHRSEGLGLTMAEAMLLGKPVIATGYSGNMEFMTPDNSLLVDYRLVTLGEEIPPYEADYQWAEPSEDHAAALMRRLFEDRAFARDLGARAKADAGERLSVVAAGRRIASRLAEIQALRKASRHPGTPT